MQDINPAQAIMAPKKTAAVKATAVAKKDIKPKKEKKVKDPNAVSPFSNPLPETARNDTVAFR